VLRQFPIEQFGEGPLRCRGSCAGGAGVKVTLDRAFGVEREPAALVIEEVESGLGAMHRAYLA